MVRPRWSSGAMSVSTTVQPVSSGPAGALPPAIAIDLTRVGRQEGVAGPALSSFERLEEKAVRSPMQLGKRGDRGIAVQDDLPDHRHHPSGAGALGEELEARRSLGAGHDVAAGCGEGRAEIVGRGPGGREQLDLIVGQQSPHREHPLRRRRRCRRPAGPGRGRRSSGSTRTSPPPRRPQRQAGGEVQPIDAGPGVHVDLHGAPAVAKGTGLEAQPREGDALSGVVEHDDARGARGEGHRRVGWGRTGSLQHEDPREGEHPWRRRRSARGSPAPKACAPPHAQTSASSNTEPGCPAHRPPGYCAHQRSER